MNKKTTLDSQDIAYFFANLKNKPVFAYCAYNNYRLLKVVDIGDAYLLVSPEDEGCWMPSESIKNSNNKQTSEISINVEDNNEPGNT